jgi:septum site-determining protein MinD
MRRITAVISGKGGVGKTTITSNLGLALHRAGVETIVVDGDFKNPNLGLHLGMYEYNYNLQEVLRRGGSILEALHIHRSGLRVIPASLSLAHLDLVVTRIREIFGDIKGHILIDSSPGMGEDVVSVLRACDDIFVVTSPEHPAVIDALKSIEVARHMDKKISGVIINRVGRKGYELKTEEIEALCGLPLLGVVPEDENVRKSIMMKTPVLELKPLSPASVAIREIAARISGETFRKPRFLRLRRFFGA